MNNQKITAFVHRPRRRKAGRAVAAPFYHLRWKQGRGGHYQSFSLGVRDKQVAAARKTEFIRQKERELSGICEARPILEAAQRPLSDHVQNFVNKLSGQQRSDSHVRHVETRIRKLMADCAWKTVGDVTAESFECWRADQNELSAKTLNEYLNAAPSMFTWMKRTKLIREHPLEGVDKIELAGKTRLERRAFTIEEVGRLLGVA